MGPTRTPSLVIASLVCSCYAGVSGTGADGSTGAATSGVDTTGVDTAGDSTGEPADCSSTQSPGAPVPMRRLTALQVQRSVADILGVTMPLEVDDEKLFTFKSNVSSAVDFAGARGYLDFAEATVLAADRSMCAEPSVACTTWLFDDVGRRLFRRPLSSGERAGYEELFAAGAAEDGGGPEGARWVLEAMLQSPSFLYMDEVARADGYLDDHSIASRLALTLWGANPDAALLDRAAAGELSTPEQVQAEAARLLADPRSVGGLTDFVDQWLRLERLNDPDARPDLEALGAETLAAMRAEPVQLLSLVLAQQGDITTLFTSSETATSPLLAPLYGADLVEAGETTMLDPSHRAGLLTLPGVMAALSHAEGTSPTLRGFNVLANVLCTPPPPPPPGVSVTLPEIGPDATTRERLEAHFSDPSCAGCHAPMDGMGFTFESLDWLGRYREAEHGKPIDDASTFPLDGVDVSVEGPVELAAVLADSGTAPTCIARQWTSYAAGTPDKEATACLIEQLAADAREPDGLRALILGLVASDWYRMAPEIAP
ncbi:MAG: DUF1592 domain-containing protein [Deltaproteobacteria bacterium]|nr:DUF1592 domain-containing protein [Deltaproteobacteria bacterium]MBK8236964.1 DUF1592 domain-containing protein [Deltaproteobacteria bacterium]MBP7289786.1 DUF1592 domain-containing protein [Nannocystaceae bacterium]